MHGYKAFFNNKSSRSGGLALFLDINFFSSYKVIYDFTFLFDHIETLCVEVDYGEGPIMMCLVYRRPGSDFFLFMENYMAIINFFKNKNCIVCGDFTLNLLG